MLRRLASNQRGSVIVMFALALTGLAGLAGLVVDVGYLYVQHAHLQNGVDAACLAGAAKLPNPGNAEVAAQQYAAANKLNAAKLVTAFPSNNRINVSYSEEFGTFFLRVLGINSATISVAAAAILPPGGPGDPAVLALARNATRPTLLINGNDTIIDGTAHSNSLLKMNGGITVTGDVTSTGSPLDLGDRVTVEGRSADGASPVEAPDYSAQIDAQASTTFSGDQKFKGANGNSINLDGTIMVDGAVNFYSAIHINGNNISGSTSLLATGDIHTNGNSITQAGEGTVFIYSSSGDIHINGKDITLNAILYAPHGEVVINGNDINITGRIIGNTVTINGARVTISNPGGGGTGLGTIPQLIE